MNILIVCNHYAVCSGRYAADAFTRLGHDVRHIGPDMGREIWGLTLPAEYAWKPNNDWDGNVRPGTDYDLTIVMDSDPALLDAFERRALGMLPIVWGVDNHVRDYRRPHFAHYFLAHRNVSVMAWEKTIVDVTMPSNDMTHLPCAYDPVHFTPSPIPFAEREYDVCCLGVMYPNRVALVDALRKAGLKVLAGCGLVYEAYAQAHHNSRIALCASVAGDVANRVFESAAMGCAVLMDKCRDSQLIGLIDGANCFEYTSMDEAVSISKWLSRAWDEERPVRYDMEVDGVSRALATTYISKAWAKPHTWDARAQVIVNWYRHTYEMERDEDDMLTGRSFEDMQDE